MQLLLSRFLLIAAENNNYVVIAAEIMLLKLDQMHQFIFLHLRQSIKKDDLQLGSGNHTLLHTRPLIQTISKYAMYVHHGHRLNRN